MLQRVNILFSDSGVEASVDSSVDVNPDDGGGGGGEVVNKNKAAVTGLAVTLGLLLLAMLVAAIFYKREVITDWLIERREAMRKEPEKEISSQRSSLTDKQRRNNQV